MGMRLGKAGSFSDTRRWGWRAGLCSQEGCEVWMDGESEERATQGLVGPHAASPGLLRLDLPLAHPSLAFSQSWHWQTLRSY